MEHVPAYVGIFFGLTTLLTLFLFYKATRSLIPVIVIVAWLLLQGVIAFAGFYKITNTLPPRFLLLIAPPVLAIVILFATNAGRRFMDRLDGKFLMLLHIVRIPVELVLYALYVYKVVPELMTFEGSNFDTLSGITAPFIFYFGYIKKRLNNTVLLSWNIICLLLLFNIVIRAVLSAPLVFQQFAFDQPNIALMYFPFIWLPCGIVPLVLFSHLVSIRQLLHSKQKSRV